MKKCTNCGAAVIAIEVELQNILCSTQNQANVLDYNSICNYLVEQGDQGIGDGILVGEDSRSLASALGGKPLEAGEEGGKFDEGRIGLVLHRAIQIYSFGQRFDVQITKLSKSKEIKTKVAHLAAGDARADGGDSGEGHGRGSGDGGGGASVDGGGGVGVGGVAEAGGEDDLRGGGGRGDQGGNNDEELHLRKVRA